MSISIAELFPGCEAFLSDEKAPTEDENQEMYNEASEMNYEVQIETMKADALLRTVDEITDLREHISKFGVDRTFLSLVNKNNKLGRFLNIRLPACESFDVVGSPDSNLSLVCMEGIGSAIANVFRSIVNMIKAIGSWIATKLKQFFSWISSWFKSADEEEKIKTIHLLWKKFSNGEWKSYEGNDKNVPTFKMIGMDGYKAIQDALAAIQGQITGIINNNSDDAKCAQDADKLSNYLKGVSEIVKKDKVTVDLIKMQVIGKNTNYPIAQWWTATSVVFQRLPMLKQKLEQIKSVVEKKYRDAEAFAKSKNFTALTYSSGNTNASTSQQSTDSNTKAASDDLKTLKEKVAGLNKLRNALTSLGSNIFAKVIHDIDVMEDKLTKLANKSESANINNETTDNETAGKSASSETK